MNFDVVIVGASSSGLYVAEQLSLAGLSVGVFERQVELNPARRTYIITPSLGKVLTYIPESAVMHRINTMAVAIANSSVDIPLQEPDLIVERNMLIQHLAKKARKVGVQIHLGYRFERFVHTGTQTDVQFLAPDGKCVQVASKAVVGADGVNSRVAAAAKIPLPPSVPIIQAEVNLPADWDPTVTQVWFDVAETHFFYWLIPESKGRAVVGMVGDKKAETAHLLNRFLDKYGFQAESYQAGTVAMHHPGLRPWAQMGRLPIYLIGDAAGQVKVTTVGGSVTGFQGAQAAVRSIMSGTPYPKELKALNRELNLHWGIRALLEQWDNQGYEKLVQAFNPAVVDFLSRHNRDEMAGVFWKLALLQPKFVPMGGRLLFRFLRQQFARRSISLEEMA